MKFLSFIAVLFFVTNAFGQVLPKGFTDEQMTEMARVNQQLANSIPVLGFDTLLADTALENTTVSPYAEYEAAGYLLFSSDFSFGSLEAKKKMAENLPENMTLVVYTQGKSEKHLEKIKNQFAKWIAPERLEVVSLANASRGFWARDGVPVPVWRENKAGEKVFTVVDAKYYHAFEADQEIAELFQSELTAHPYYYEGGNFMANSVGDCVVVNTRATQKVPDDIFRSHYGCARLIRLPFTKGIGHIDESFKFITDTVVLTDEPKYVDRLTEAGFEVKMMPRPQRKYETYVNTLLVNGVAFVPVFDQEKDAEALKVFEDLGFKAVPMPSVSLSNQGLGSIHCITMVYPPVEFSALVDAIGGSN